MEIHIHMTQSEGMSAVIFKELFYFHIVLQNDSRGKLRDRGYTENWMK